MFRRREFLEIYRNFREGIEFFIGCLVGSEDNFIYILKFRVVLVDNCLYVEYFWMLYLFFFVVLNIFEMYVIYFICSEFRVYKML